MILNEFFNLYQTESLADDFMKMAREKGYNPTLRTGPQPTKPPSTFTSNPTSSDVDRSAVQTELDQLQKQFDPDYQYSDDYTFWSKQNRIAQRMSVLKKLLANGQQGVAEGWGYGDGYDKGFSDGYDGQRKNNPFPPGSKEHKEYDEGWFVGRLDYNKMNRDSDEQGVAEGSDDTVGFEVDSENAYNKVLEKFGTVIDWHGDAMVAPRKYWGAIQELAHSAGGEATEVGDEHVAEAKPEDSKIGGRYTPNEFDSKLARIKANHQANPANTTDLAARLQAAYKKQTPVAESRQKRKSLLKQILKG
jgi:hypothetical protein